MPRNSHLFNLITDIELSESFFFWLAPGEVGQSVWGSVHMCSLLAMLCTAWVVCWWTAFNSPKILYPYFSLPGKRHVDLSLQNPIARWLVLEEWLVRWGRGQNWFLDRDMLLRHLNLTKLLCIATPKRKCMLKFPWTGGCWRLSLTVLCVIQIRRFFRFMACLGRGATFVS